MPNSFYLNWTFPQRDFDQSAAQYILSSDFKHRFDSMYAKDPNIIRSMYNARLTRCMLLTLEEVWEKESEFLDKLRWRQSIKEGQNVWRIVYAILDRRASWPHNACRTWRVVRIWSVKGRKKTKPNQQNVSLHNQKIFLFKERARMSSVSAFSKSECVPFKVLELA